MSTLRFRNLTIRRTPGFPGGTPAMEFGSPDVTIVYGPNASGKTTTARVLRALLWPEAHKDGEYSAQGRFEYDDAAWIVDLDTGLVKVQRDGLEADHPVFMPVEIGDRYLLGLHELAMADNRRFAESILKESSGGYDLGEAAGSLDFKDKTPHKGSEYGALEHARARVHEARDRHERLREQEAELAQLRARREEAVAAGRRVDEVRRAIGFQEAAQRLKAAEIAVGEFPEEIGRLSGNEGVRLEDIVQKIALETQRRDASQNSLKKARARIEATGLPGGGAPAALLQALTKQVEELDQKTTDIQNLQKDLAQAESDEKAEQGRLGDDLTAERLLNLDLAGWGRLAEFAREAEKLRGDRAAYEAMREWIGRDEAPRNLDVLKEGMGLLYRWMADTGDSASLSGNRRFTLVIAGMALAAGIVLGYFQHWAFASLSIAGIVLVAWAWGRAGRSLSRRQREADYMKLGLTPPVAWTVDAVEERAQSLHEKINAATLSLERSQRWSGLADRRNNLDERSTRLENRKRDLVEAFGVAPDIDEASLFWLSESVRRWQDAVNRRLRVMAALSAAGIQHQDVLDSIARDQAPYGYAEVTDRVRAREALDDLRRRAEEYRQAEVEADNARVRMAEADERLDGLVRDRKKIFVDSGLEDGEDRRLRELLERRPAYLAAREEFQAAAIQVKTAENAVEGLDELKALPLGELTPRLQEAEDLAATLSDVSRSVGRIENAVHEARKGHDLEEALAVEDDARNRLREVRERDCRSVVGWLMTRYLERENRDLNLPKVFQGARSIFSRIVRGRYELEFDPHGPTFRTRDTSTGLGQSLDQLSSATRLQLLLAVRMAFVEEQEQGPRLPLLLDETLANSDEERTQAIIQSAIEFCREGRQVFYFTARHAEVAKWERLLKADGDVEYSIVDLATLRQFSEAERLPLVDAAAPPLIDIPGPEGMSHAEYGQALSVPGFDPSEEEIGGTHLWHLIDNPDFLFRLLNLGINRWGQLQTLIHHGGYHLLEDDRPALERARASARVLRSLAASWRIGRGRKVDRQALVDGGVTDKFIDRVTEIAESVSGDAARLLAALDSGQAKGFRKASLEKLKIHFEETGHLDERERLPKDQLRMHALAAAAGDIKAGLLTAANVEQIIARSIPNNHPDLPLLQD